MNKGLFGEIPEFYKSLASAPIDTLKTTWRGVTEGTPEPGYRALVPSLGVAGLGLTFLGAATSDPVALGFGILETSMSASYYHAMGRDLPPKAPTGLEAGGPG